MSELSTHKVEIVPVELEPHPNADTLSVVRVFGYTCCVRTADWQGKHVGAYIPPDSVVDVMRPEFAFLGGGTKSKHRIRAKKLRGVVSFGLLMPAPDGTEVGMDVAAHYGVEHYEPEMRSCCTGGEAEQPPASLAWLSKYDVDSLRRYSLIFQPGEMVMVTEKIHGANARYCYAEGRMWCGSRSEWKREESNNPWWRALATTPAIGDFCRHNPCHVLYGEVYGDVQSLRYGRKKTEVAFAAFDVLGADGQFLDAYCGRINALSFGVPVVPLLGVVPFDFSTICEMAEGPSHEMIANHIREGCVVKPLVDRWHQAIGRVQLKVVGAGYLEKGE